MLEQTYAALQQPRACEGSFCFHSGEEHPLGLACHVHAYPAFQQALSPTEVAFRTRATSLPDPLWVPTINIQPTNPFIY